MHELILYERRGYREIEASMDRSYSSFPKYKWQPSCERVKIYSARADNPGKNERETKIDKNILAKEVGLDVPA